MLTHTRVFWMAVAIGSPFAAAAAQGPAATSRSVSGHVRDGAGFPVRGARVGGSGQAIVATTDSTGRYRLVGLAQGPLQLVARRLGFAPETLEVTAGAVAIARADFILSEPVDHMPAVLVRAGASALDFLAGFRERARTGRGRYLTNEEIMRRGFTRMTDVVRSVPGTMPSRRPMGRQDIRLRGSRQGPLVWLDGVPMGGGNVDLDAFDPRTFAGVEIYMGAATVPVEFAGTPSMSSSGGAIVLWSLRGEARPKRPPRSRAPAALLVQDLLERGEAFRTDEVDEAATPVGGAQALVPAYPESLRRPGAKGTIIVEFVVDTAGVVRMPTFGVVLTSHPLLVDPVREVLAEQRFTPARRAGRPVAQVLLLPFTFAADSIGPASRPER
jgi:hypothetical protein